MGLHTCVLHCLQEPCADLVRGICMGAKWLPTFLLLLLHCFRAQHVPPEVCQQVDKEFSVSVLQDPVACLNGILEPRECETCFTETEWQDLQVALWFSVCRVPPPPLLKSSPP